MVVKIGDSMPHFGSKWFQNSKLKLATIAGQSKSNYSKIPVLSKLAGILKNRLSPFEVNIKSILGKRRKSQKKVGKEEKVKEFSRFEV